MENQTEKSSKFVMFLIPVLTILGFLSTVVWFIAAAAHPEAGLGMGVIILSIIAYIVAMVYALHGYKKPHGNMLRYTFLVFAVSLALYSDTQLAQISSVTVLINVICTVPVAYMAGRLHKFNQNKVLLYIVVVMLLIAGIIDFVWFTPSMAPGVAGGFLFAVLKFSTLNKFILSLALAAAYVSRFRTHKEAGLADDEKKKK